MVPATHNVIAHVEDETLASRGATILVVEDEEMLREAVSKMLRKKGLSVIEASDGICRVGGDSSAQRRH